MNRALELVADPRCQRGLRFTLRLPDPTPDRERLHAALVVALPEAIAGFERWAEQRVDRLIVQFRVEVRIGERPGELGILFRSCGPAPERERLGELLLATVAQLYEPETS